MKAVNHDCLIFHQYGAKNIIFPRVIVLNNTGSDSAEREQLLHRVYRSITGYRHRQGTHSDLAAHLWI